MSFEQSTLAIPPAVATALPTCPSCHAAVGSRFCGECGQRRREGRLTLRSTLSRWWNDVSSLDRGFLHTVVALSLRPAEVVRDYLQGRTVRYTTPLKYLLVTVALITFLTLKLDLAAMMEDGYRAGADFMSASPDRASESTADVAMLLREYMNVLMIAAVPFSALCTWLLFRRAGLNLAEHLVFNVYVYGHQCLIFSTAYLSLLAGVGALATNALGTALSTVYFVWAAVSFFGYSRFSAFLRALAAVVLTLIAYSAVSAVFMLAYTGRIPLP
jgi:hypothetical protein